MQVDLKQFINNGETVAVATSGGSDSMALLDFMLKKAEQLHFSVIAINIEHGIRGQESINDSNFVKDYCLKRSVPLLSYTVDSLKKAKDDKLSVEQAARTLRYQCFFDAIKNGKCDKVATAHHLSDNFESVLFNLFRGTGLKGLSGIEENFDGKIIRPFLSVSKDQLNEYITINSIPYVTDQTNFDDDYTRNHIRLNVIPQIKKAFPEAEKSVFRLTEIIKSEHEFMSEQAENVISVDGDVVKISLPTHPAVLSRAIISALKRLGVKKDWEKVHIDSVCALSQKQNGAKVNLLDKILAVKEYDKITLYRNQSYKSVQAPFKIGITALDKKSVSVSIQPFPIDLKSGLFGDLSKIPENAQFRFRKSDDVFTKFGGGTKNLNDYFTDLKIPVRLRDFIPLLAVDNKVLVIFGVAVSNSIKVDKKTETVLKFE
ncbi:MAG: tRNA lysidine(34) synthetase TilS [Clostridia bacterium]|nr:tRNA lysidine(34) synthetase TilS [Clostridia bacterium]